MEILGLVWLGSRTAEYQRMRDFVAIVPVGRFYDQSNIDELNTDEAFAPANFRPVFRVQ